MGLYDIFSYIDYVINSIYSDIKVVAAEATTGSRDSEELGKIKKRYKDSVKKSVEESNKRV